MYMSPGEEQHTSPDSNTSEDTTLVDGQLKPSIGKQTQTLPFVVSQ